MLVSVFDWHTIAGTDCVEIPCPVCHERHIVPRKAADVDGCVFLARCGCATVQLVGWCLLAPPIQRATGAAS